MLSNKRPPIVKKINTKKNGNAMECTSMYQTEKIVKYYCHN